MTETADHYEHDRDRHLFGPGPKRILALQGGGLRGVVAIAFLERIEAILSARTGRPEHLCDWFDLIGGSSMSAIVAGMLALGYRTSDIKDVFFDLAPRVYRDPFRPIRWRHTRFDERSLTPTLRSICGDCALSSYELVTGIAITVVRADTGASNIVSNNPRGPLSDFVAGNKSCRLENIIAASIGPPNFTPRSVIFDARCDVVDASCSPDGNPSLAILQTATSTRHGLCWSTGPDQLTIVSIGAGNSYSSLPGGTARIVSSTRSLEGLVIGLAHRAALVQMQWLGKCETPMLLNSELRSPHDEEPAGGKLFRLYHYDLPLNESWIRSSLGLDISGGDVARMCRMDDSGIVQKLYAVARAAAEQHVTAGHFALATVPARLGNQVPRPRLRKLETRS